MTNQQLVRPSSDGSVDHSAGDAEEERVPDDAQVQHLVVAVPDDPRSDVEDQPQTFLDEDADGRRLARPELTQDRVGQEVGQSPGRGTAGGCRAPDR